MSAEIGHPFYGNQWTDDRNVAASLSVKANDATRENGNAIGYNENKEGNRFSPIRHEELANNHKDASEAWTRTRNNRIASGEGKKGDNVDKSFASRARFHSDMEAGHRRSVEQLNAMWKRREMKED